VNDSIYDTSAEDLKKSLESIDKGTFSSLLTNLISKYRDTDFGPIIRNVCRSLAIEEGYFALHADEKSYLLYDVQFHLYSSSHPVQSDQEYLDAYPGMIAFGDGELKTGGYAPDFIKVWFDTRLLSGDIIKGADRLRFSDKFLKTFATRLQEFH